MQTFSTLAAHLTKRTKRSAVWTPTGLEGWAHLHRDFKVEGWEAKLGRTQLELLEWKAPDFDELFEWSNIWQFLAFFCGCAPIAAEHQPEGLVIVSLTGRHSVFAMDDWEWGISPQADSLENWAEAVAASDEARLEGVRSKGVPAWDDPLRLFSRAEWFASLFMGTDPFGGGIVPKVPTPAQWKAEHPQVGTRPHLAAYWLIHHALVGQAELLELALDAAMPLANDPVVKALAPQMVALLRGKVPKWIAEARPEAHPHLRSWAKYLTKKP